MKDKMTFTKLNRVTGEQMVKRTKSADLAKILEKDGWKHETAGAVKAKGGEK